MPDALARRAVSHRGRPALTFDGRTWAFDELDRLAGASAGALAAAGFRAGDRVALLARNGPGFVVTVHAAARAGVTLVPLNVRLTIAELAWQLRDCGATALLHDERLTDLALEAARLAGGVPVRAVAEDGRSSASADGPAISGSLPLDRVQGIVYTSGTTGRPKGAKLTLGNWWWGALGSALHLGHDRGDRWLAALPLYHVGGLAILFRSAIGGVPVTLLDGFEPDEARRAIARDRVTLVSLVATTLARLLDAPGAEADLRSLRVALVGGGPTPPSLVEEALRRGVPVAPTYGLTEAASQAATLLPDEVAAHPGAAGSALPQVEIRIENDGEPADPGVAGEIVVRGRSVMEGYLGMAPRAPDAWFRTGDIGHMDDGGFLTVLDRRDDLIVSGGENVYPAEVEAALLRHPAVREAAVVGFPDERWGSVPLAFVVFRPGARPTDAELLSASSIGIAAYKRPRRIVAVDALPRTSSGKMLRRELRERLGA